MIDKGTVRKIELVEKCVEASLKQWKRIRTDLRISRPLFVIDWCAGTGDAEGFKKSGPCGRPGTPLILLEALHKFGISYYRAYFIEKDKRKAQQLGNTLWKHGFRSTQKRYFEIIPRDNRDVMAEMLEDSRKYFNYIPNWNRPTYTAEVRVPDGLSILDPCGMSEASGMPPTEMLNKFYGKDEVKNKVKNKIDLIAYCNYGRVIAVDHNPKVDRSALYPNELKFGKRCRYVSDTFTGRHTTSVVLFVSNYRFNHISGLKNIPESETWELRR